MVMCFGLEGKMDKKLYDLMDWAEIETIVYSEHDHPENILGPHKVKGGVLIQAFLPDAKTVFVRSKKSGMFIQMSQTDEDGCFAALMESRKIVSYEYVIDYGDGKEYWQKDPYLYGNLIPEQALEDFNAGKAYDIYRYLGAHPVAVKGIGKDVLVDWNPMAASTKRSDMVQGTFFAVWAPNAMRVSVVGDFNQWDGRRHPMCRLGDSGVFGLFIPDIGCGDIYKYELKYNARTIALKSDPYGFQYEDSMTMASIITDLQNFLWEDAEWMQKRQKIQITQEALNIYEVSLDGWLSKEDKDAGKGYRDAAKTLAKYVKEMGYTHIQLMPLMERVQKNSYGYPTVGYYAIRSCYGTPKDFMYFVDYMHQNGIGVIMEWIPGYFSTQEQGLAMFDGTCLYEHLNPLQGLHPFYDAMLFQYERPEVANFLLTNALYWKEMYHLDGICVGGMETMLYLDYGRKEGEWIPNRYGGNENLGGIDVLKKLAALFHQKEDGAILIAKEEMASLGVTDPLEDNGLGFDLKWNICWTSDFLKYMKLDPLFRKGSHGLITMEMLYHYSANFILTISHRDTWKKKSSLFENMPGTIYDKFSNIRVGFGYMITHPGKKMLFMGEEFGVEDRKNPDGSLDWEQAQSKEHAQLQRYVKDLNMLYRNHTALYVMDYRQDGFEWISCMDADHSIIAFLRKDQDDILLVICNFTPVLYENFKVGVPFMGRYKEIFNSDRTIYGGAGYANSNELTAKEVSWDGRSHSIAIKLPPYGFCVFRAVSEK